ncbi:PAS/PAC sensor signal transduction histidine kinase [Desulfatibacillum aliphaticivorans]|uniref:histidine kinase n=1 Tax=Desulfatibacillum aliphaticivorans TaxID=218208 RepID=B8FA30_DESAL|nr:ATP-binding protein [Desulfatibacillum aliphaticivorans]ACL03126.1 PAS/PAC sensor signal transduction histidine kinase [Desulfatibacillum aliphaticivorans]
MKKKRRLFLQLFPSYLIVILISIVAVAWYASSAMSKFYLSNMEQDLMGRAQFVEPQIVQLLDPPNLAALDNLCKSVGRRTQTRITVILPTGRVVGDSDENPKNMDNHVDRPEVIGASAGKITSSIRFSRTLDEKMMYMAVPTKQEDKTTAIIRTAVSVSSLDEAVSDIRGKIAAGGLIIAFFAAIIALLAARRITRPIEQMKKWSESISRGDFNFSPPEAKSEEIESLSKAMNQMAKDLKGRIDFITRQKNQMEAVLASMVEGVIALDTGQRIISMNQAAGRMLSCDPRTAAGKTIQETVRNTDFHDFVLMAFRSESPVEEELVLSGKHERYFKVRGMTLRDAQAQRMGALVVLNDMTQVTKLENMRRDFVANVSHEIKTPITAIKGFVETLLDGALDDKENAKRFLEIISRHTDRLKAIVEDLLELSRIEQAGGRELPLERASVKEALETAVQVCEARAISENITVEMDCPDDLTAVFDPTMIEQAVVNLLDNAVKYSEEHGVVRVGAKAEGGEVLIWVEDEGPGISEEHLPRLFERFYRVDKARSRNLGGTGLGLAIVKHIMAAHGGHVSVKSEKGKGAAFTLHLNP